MMEKTQTIHSNWMYDNSQPKEKIIQIFCVIYPNRGQRPSCGIIVVFTRDQAKIVKFGCDFKLRNLVWTSSSVHKYINIFSRN